MSGNNSLVSVIIPAYNHEKFIQETIQSIINQTYQNIELIIVDDGSSDNTWQKIQEMREVCEKRFSRVVFETKHNEGTCLTLNKLISLSQGEYVFITASDDVARPQLIEKEVDFLSKNQDYALVVFNNGIMDANSKVCNWDATQNIVYDINDYKKDNIYSTFGHFLENHMGFKFTSDEFGTYKNVYRNNHIPNGYLIKQSIFKKTGLYIKEAPLEDYYMNLQISKYAKMKFFDEVQFYYRWHGDNTIIVNGNTINEYDRMTREHENGILDKISITDRNVLPDVIDVKYNRDIGLLQKNIDHLKTAELELRQNIQLVANCKTVNNKYLRYKIFSKILFGKKRKHYKEKAEIYHEKVRTIRNLKNKY